MQSSLEFTSHAKTFHLTVGPHCPGQISYFIKSGYTGYLRTKAQLQKSTTSVHFLKDLAPWGGVTRCATKTKFQLQRFSCTGIC